MELDGPSVRIEETEDCKKGDLALLFSSRRKEGSRSLFAPPPPPPVGKNQTGGENPS